MEIIVWVVAAPDDQTVGSLALADVLLMPPAEVAWRALFPTEKIWPHLGPMRWWAFPVRPAGADVAECAVRLARRVGHGFPQICSTGALGLVLVMAL